MRPWSFVLAAVLALAGSVGALAQTSSSHMGPLQMALPVAPVWTRPAPMSPAQLAQLAVNCNHCHSADGLLQQFLRSTGESLVVPPPLVGMPEDQIFARVDAFRRNDSQAAAMHRLAIQYDQQQLRELAAYLARQTAMR